MDEIKKIKGCFCSFIEGSLISHDIDSVVDLFTEDIMGIGMGAQGIVRCKADTRPILLNTRSDVQETQTTVDYSNMQIRYYGDDYATICATLTISTQARGKLQKSHIGQCASLRRIEGIWKINMLQATPLSVDIQEIDAYPLSFAEDEIEKYRIQEQFSKVMQKNVISTYKIDFELGIYESYIPTGKYTIPVETGDAYENTCYKTAEMILNGETRIQFLQTFSISNLTRCYQAGQPDVTMDYESIQSDGRLVWLRSNLHLFTDIKGHLKGYLYLFDIDQEKREELNLTKQAELDLMTAVYNKETFRKKIEAAIRLYSMPKTCALFMIDLDCFKMVNDTYGHAEGDHVIKETASILKNTFRKEDIVGRIGGDEFCVFYTGKNNVIVLEKKAEEICTNVRKIQLHNNRLNSSKVSVSIGIVRRLQNENFFELYQRADQALYERKSKLGRNGYTFYENMHPA
ncbi:GGDEF domain-containing protein [uncultured Robinsoniella sp.]|uniref:GGDEF domain-containing protein n=1 Tax=uncultured Robinsoniella sp. TaxID=904190 RepID=UPI00374FA80F